VRLLTELIIVHCRENTAADQLTNREPPRQSHPIQSEPAVNMRPQESFVDDHLPAERFG